MKCSTLIHTLNKHNLCMILHYDDAAGYELEYQSVASFLKKKVLSLKKVFLDQIHIGYDCLDVS